MCITPVVYMWTLLQTVSGCDSVVSMNLTIPYSTTYNDTVSGCNYHFWNGRFYYNTGIYVDTLQTSAGCDSIVILDLTVNYFEQTVSDTLEVCDSISWQGNTYTSTGKNIIMTHYKLYLVAIVY